MLALCSEGDTIHIFQDCSLQKCYWKDSHPKMRISDSAHETCRNTRDPWLISCQQMVSDFLHGCSGLTERVFKMPCLVEAIRLLYILALEIPLYHFCHVLCQMSHQIQPRLKEREAGLYLLNWGIAEHLHHIELPHMFYVWLYQIIL